MVSPIYLDYNGTTPHAPEVIEAMWPFFETEFGNPSSSHWYGIAPKKAIMTSREQVASLLGCSADEILFTSGGTESNNHAIKAIAGSLFAKGNHIITSSIEHPAILEVCRFMEAHGFDVTVLPVDASGHVNIDDVAAAITEKTVLITIMHANNEVGSIQDINQIASLARQHGILMHTDAAQSAGKIDVNVEKLGVDLLSLAGHKLYAPKGVGALYIRRGIEAPVFCHGAGQENGRRAGTENVLEIVGLGKACEIAKADLKKNHAHMQKTRDLLERGLRTEIEDIQINGHKTMRLPNTCSVSFYGIEANRLLEEIGLDIAASAGAACHADHMELSHVLEAMKLPVEWAKGTLRFTTGRFTTEEQIKMAVEILKAAVNNLRE